MINRPWGEKNKARLRRIAFVLKDDGDEAATAFVDDFLQGLLQLFLGSFGKVAQLGLYAFFDH